MRISIFFLAVIFILPLAGVAQNYNLRLERISNDGSNLVVKVQMSLTGAENLGSANLVFTYSGTEINTPVLGTVHNFSGGNYQAMTLTSPASNTVSLNIEYTGADAGGTALATGGSWTDVANISFTLPDQSGTANFQWQELDTRRTVVYQDNNSNRLSKGTLTDNNMSLIALTFAAPADLCLDAGVQSGLGGGTPTGGVYSGPGVTDEGNGMTYSFDPVTAGVGTHTISYTNGGSVSDNVQVFVLPV